jgi:hypothetical protein
MATRHAYVDPDDYSGPSPWSPPDIKRWPYAEAIPPDAMIQDRINIVHRVYEEVFPGRTEM